METGNVIREYRILRKMTQEELAAALLVTPQAVSRWETGLEILKGETCGVPVDVCILDINMPGMNGLEVLEVIKRDYPDLKVIMLSAMRREEIVKKTLELGADSFVAKPFQASVLAERI